MARPKPNCLRPIRRVKAKTRGDRVECSGESRTPPADYLQEPTALGLAAVRVDTLRQISLSWSSTRRFTCAVGVHTRAETE